jgi:hypothetical protein
MDQTTYKGTRKFNRSKKRRIEDQQAIAEKLAEIGPTTAAELNKQLPPRKGTKIPRTNRQVGLDLGALERLGRVEKRGYIRDGSRSGSQSWAIVDGRTYAHQSSGSKAMKEKFKEKWPVSEWEKFDEELAILEVDVETATTPEDMQTELDELNERMEFRRWKKANDLKVIQKELEKASKTHKTQSEIIEAINRNYSRRNSAMFTRSTGTYRQFGGKRFILDDVYGTKDQAQYMAGYWRARGMNARVIPVKNGSAIYVRKKGSYPQLRQPGISSRRRGK